MSIRGWSYLAIGALILLVLVGRDPLSKIFGGSSASSIGWLRSPSGEIVVRRAGRLDKEIVTTEKVIEPNDRVDIGPKSTANLHLKNGYEIRLESESQVIIEKDMSSAPPLYRLNFISGSFKLIKEGTGPGDVVAVVKNNTQELRTHRTPKENLTIAAEIPGKEPTPSSSETSQVPVIVSPVPSTAPKPLVASVPRDTISGASLPDDHIEVLIKSQKGHFSRCFTDLLQSKPRAQGRLDISFTIEARGNVSRTKVLASALSDEKFHKCVLSVFDRLKFKAFDGQPIVVNYPLQFD